MLEQCNHNKLNLKKKYFMSGVKLTLGFELNINETDWFFNQILELYNEICSGRNIILIEYVYEVNFFQFFV